MRLMPVTYFSDHFTKSPRARRAPFASSTVVKIMLSGVDGTKVTEGQPSSLVDTRSLSVSTARLLAKQCAVKRGWTSAGVTPARELVGPTRCQSKRQQRQQSYRSF